MPPGIAKIKATLKISPSDKKPKDDKATLRKGPLGFQEAAKLFPKLDPVSPPASPTLKREEFSEEKEVSSRGSSPALVKDKRRFRVPQGPVGRNAHLIDRTCPKCQSKCERKITRTSNRNDNANRPYAKCTSARCDKFVCWLDDEGTFEGNPLCKCGEPSRQSISNRDKGRQIYYECVDGVCTFWQAHVDANGKPVRLDGDISDELDRTHL